jgi:hypothetical protein
MITYAQQSTVKGELCKSEVRAESQNAPDMSGATIRQRGSKVNRSKPNGLLTWHALDTEQCPVRCTTGLSGAPSTATTRIVVGAINTPNHLHSSHPSFLYFTFNTKAIAFTQDTFQRSNPLQASQSTQLLSDLREGVLCSFVALVAWIGFSFLFVRNMP